MLLSLILYTLLIITIDAYMYFFANTKYKGYLKMRDYLNVLKNPMYKKVLICKIIVVNVIVILFSIIF